MILGLDPANNCGWCVVSSDNRTIDYGCWALKQKTDEHPGRRLERFRRLLFSTHKRFQITGIAYEDAVQGSKFFHVQQSHSEFRGVILLCGAELEIPTTPINPMTLKAWLTGSGKAKKPDMISAVRRRFSIATNNDNEADAIAVAFYHLHQNRIAQAESEQIKLPF